MARKENKIKIFRQYGAVHRKTKRSWELQRQDGYGILLWTR